MPKNFPDGRLLTGKTALVTGVSKGLGLAVARRLLAEGWVVCGTSRTETNEWKMLVAQYGERADWRQCDLANVSTVKDALFETWIPLRRPLHAFVNNAAVAYDDLITNVAIGRLETMFAVNVLSPISIAREVLRNMVFNGTNGSVVHVSSISVRSGSRGLAMYAATKGALEAFSRNTAREWGGRGIRSNCVVPGYMDTDMTAAMSAERKEKIHRRAALGNATEVESVASTIQFLLSDGASSITGQDLVVDAGLI